MSDWGEEIPSGGGLAPGATRLRIAQPRWIQRLVAEQMSKAAGRSDAAGAKPPFEVAPFLFGVQGDFLKFDGAAAAKLSFANFDAAFDRGGLVAVDPSSERRRVSSGTGSWGEAVRASDRPRNQMSLPDPVSSYPCPETG